MALPLIFPRWQPPLLGAMRSLRAHKTDSVTKHLVIVQFKFEWYPSRLNISVKRINILFTSQIHKIRFWVEQVNSVDLESWLLLKCL